MVKIFKEDEGRYTAYNDKTGASADIIKIHEYSACGKTPIRYRVDYQGCTKDSMIPLTEAKSLARKLVK